MTTDPHYDSELWAARYERALRWLHTDLKGYPTVSAEETLAAAPRYCQVKPWSRIEVCRQQAWTNDQQISWWDRED